MTLYQDQTVTLDEAGLSIANFFYPGNRRDLPYESIERATIIDIGRLSGKHRLVGLGFRRPRHFFTWDRSRSTNSNAICLDTGRFFRIVITPDDPDEVDRILRLHQGS